MASIGSSHSISHSPIDVPTLRYLVFSGGGTRGLSYVGALDALQRRGLDFARRGVLLGTAGTSIGSLIACLVAAGFSAEELTHTFCALDMSSLFSFNLALILLRFGLDDSGRLMAFIDAQLHRKLGSAGGGAQRWTLADMRARTGVDLVVVATDLARDVPVYLRAASHPRLAVSEAVAASMAIPPVFAPISVGSQLMVDGGLADNFPLQLFPASQTLGMRVHWTSAFTLDTLDQYFSRVAYCALSASEAAQWSRLPAEAKARTVEINTGNIQTVELRLDDAEKHRVIASGKEAVDQFFERAAAAHGRRHGSPGAARPENAGGDADRARV